MALFDRFYPQNYIESAYDLPYDELFRQGYRGIIFDIDNTLVAHGAPANEQALKLFSTLHEIGFRTAVLSNNDEPRVKSFAASVGAGYICNAGKPRVKNYVKAMEILGTGKAETFFVGDQLFTDIWGANRAGIKNYLVKQIAKKETAGIILKRFLEKIVWFFYRRVKA